MSEQPQRTKEQAQADVEVLKRKLEAQQAAKAKAAERKGSIQ